MNKVILSGRLTADPESKQAQNENGTIVTRYTLAVDRRFKREGEPEADFIRCVTFGKTAEFAGQYLRKGVKIIVCGKIQTGSYTKEDGTKVFTTDVVVEEHEFCEKKETQTGDMGSAAPAPTFGGAISPAQFEDVTDDDDLPF